MTPSRVRILVADDEETILTVLTSALRSEGYTVFTAAGGAAACEIAEREQIHLALVDLTMPDRPGMEVLKFIREHVPAARVIMMTAYASAETAVGAMKLGALDYLIKPFSMDELKLQIRRAVGELSLTQENRALRRVVEQSAGVVELIGKNRAFLTAVDLARRLASDDATVLVTGETGTGKELIARLLHECAEKRTGAFLAINCAAIPESMLERELFGHEKGAFTGADAARPGLVEAAEDGTLLLDEIGEMSPPLQAKLLRVIDGAEFLRLGGTRPVKVHTRFIAATNRDLAKLVAEGKFRQDLYYRLNVLQIALPPLRERGDDIALLAEHFRRRFAAEKGRRVSACASEAISALKSYPWPGNVRELRNVMERAVVLCAGEQIESGDLHLGAPSAGHGSGFSGTPWDTLPFRDARMAFERAYLEGALRSTGGNVTKAAGQVGLDRVNLHAKMKKLGLQSGK